MRRTDKKGGSNRAFRLLLTAALLAPVPAVWAGAEESSVNLLGTSVSGGLPAGWDHVTFRSVKARTNYTAVEEEGKIVIKAHAVKSASALVKRIRFDPKRTPALRWRWKISNTLNGDERQKSGDDSAARVYVMFEYAPERATALKRLKYETARIFYGEYPPHAALNYIWANLLPTGAVLPNAYADNSMMIAMKSGNTMAGKWMDEKVNIYEDYIKHFGGEPPMASGVGIMTDSDNTGGEVSAWYSDITLWAAPGERALK
jgi:hypothetical protein